jgi:hypothetical protein
VVDPCVSIDQAREESDRYMQRICGGVGVGLEQRSMYLAVTGAREKLVHYPLWVVEYVYENRSYRAVVDGCTGKLLKGAFPADSEHWKKVCRVLGSVWAGLIPILLFVSFAGLFSAGPILMLVLLAVYGLGAVSFRFLKMAKNNARTDSMI